MSTDTWTNARGGRASRAARRRRGPRKGRLTDGDWKNAWKQGAAEDDLSPEAEGSLTAGGMLAGGVARPGAVDDRPRVRAVRAAAGPRGPGRPGGPGGAVRQLPEDHPGVSSRSDRGWLPVEELIGRPVTAEEAAGLLVLRAAGVKVTRNSRAEWVADPRDPRFQQWCEHRTAAGRT